MFYTSIDHCQRGCKSKRLVDSRDRWEAGGERHWKWSTTGFREWSWGLWEALKVCHLWQDKNEDLYIGDFFAGLRIKVKVNCLKGLLIARTGERHWKWTRLRVKRESGLVWLSSRALSADLNCTQCFRTNFLFSLFTRFNAAYIKVLKIVNLKGVLWAKFNLAQSTYLV